MAEQAGCVQGGGRQRAFSHHIALPKSENLKIGVPRFGCQNSVVKVKGMFMPFAGTTGDATLAYIRQSLTERRVLTMHNIIIWPEARVLFDGAAGISQPTLRMGQH